MSTPDTDKLFAGSIPALYESLLVPLIFEPYAVDLSRRLAARSPSRILEIAAGTGVVTRHLAVDLPPSAAIVATDLNPAMIEQARQVGTAREVEWRQADAMRLPFADGAFDAVVCQFGAMFFPDRGQAFAEARRVLAPGGVLLFNVWDRIEENEFADVVTTALESVFPGDPPRFLARTPHGYHDRDELSADLRRGGYSAAPTIDTLAARSRAGTAEAVSIAYCQGTPLRNEIEARDPASLAAATDAGTAAIAARFGAGPVDSKIQAHVVSVER